MAEYEIFITDANGNRIKAVTNFIRAEFIKNYNDIGTWLMEFDASFYQQGIFEFQGGVKVYRDGVVYYSGRLTAIEDVDADLPNGRVIAWGTDLIALLDTRLAVPVVLGPPYTSQANDDRTDLASNLIKAYVRANIGGDAKASRAIPALTVAIDDDLGSEINGKARFDNLLDLIIDLALKGGDVGFRFSGNEFQTFLAEDKTASVVFSRERGTLRKYRRKVTQPQANYIVAGGTGEGTTRNFKEVGNQASIDTYGRIEYFYDYRNADDAELYEASQGKLESMADKLAITLEVMDTDGTKWLRDYAIGDKVTVKLPEQTYQQVIRSETLRLDAKGENVEIVIGTPGTKAEGNMPAISQLYDKNKQSNKRILNMERR